MTLEAYLREWVLLRSAGIRPRTVESYESLIRLHIGPAIGDRKLSKLKARHIAAMLKSIVDDGHARTAQLCYALLHAALRSAVEERRIERSPIDAVKRPKHRTKRGKAWSKAQTPPMWPQSVATSTKSHGCLPSAWGCDAGKYAAFGGLTLTSAPVSSTSITSASVSRMVVWSISRPRATPAHATCDTQAHLRGLPPHVPVGRWLRGAHHAVGAGRCPSDAFAASGLAIHPFARSPAHHGY